MSVPESTEFKGGSNDVAIGYPPSIHERRTDSGPPWTHSRLTRQGYTYLEINIPPIGVTNQCKIWGYLTFFLDALSLILIPIAIAGIIVAIATDSRILYVLVAVICPVFWIGAVFCTIVLFRFWFRHQTLVMTTEEYRFTEIFVKPRAVVYAIFHPDEHSLFQNENVEGKRKKERTGSRQRFLRAKTGILEVCHGTPYGFVELDFNFLGYGLRMSELEWLAGEINDFLQAETTLSDFSGVWISFFDIAQINIFTPQGQVIVCRDTLSPECEAEITPIQDIYTFNGTTLSVEVRDRIGVTTIEKSAALHPSCAKDGIFPAERTLSIPPSEILSYDSKAERILYIDPRRPDDINCLPARYRIGRNGPYIELDHVVVYRGTIPNVFALGPSFRCEPLSQSCRIDLDDSGELDFAVQYYLNLTCISGDCLTTPSETAFAPSPSYAPYESPIDV
eukprot:g6260.t1